MIIFLACIIVLLIGVLIAVVADRIPIAAVQKPVTSEAYTPLPDGDVTASDVREVRFTVVARGYKMSQVDEVIERLQRQLATQAATTRADEVQESEGQHGHL